MSKGTQITITGRFVQGGLKLQPKTDDKGNKVMRKDDPTKQVEECFLAVAVAKTDPAFPTYWAAYNAVAKAAFPHLFDAAGTCTHPRFAWKLQDGDGVDKNGKSVKDKPGFAGHWIFKMVTQYAPRCYIKDSHGNLTQLEDPEKLIKRGYRIAVAVALDGNGVGADAGSAVPGLYASPNLVLFVAPDEEIVSGPDPNEAFAGVTTAAVPAGSAAPGIGLPGLPAGPALPPPAAAGPALPPPAAAAAGPALPGATILPPPAAPAGPVYQMQPSAQGATREQLLANNWTDEALIAAGHMIRVG
jgi:hypothetical protein